VLRPLAVKQFTKTLLLWVVLIVVLVALYRYYAALGPKDGPPLPACETPTSTVLITWSFPLVLVVAVVLWFRHWSRKYHRMDEGVSLLNEGRTLEALERFQQKRLQNPADPVLAYNIAVAQLQLWRLEETLEELETAKQKKGPGEGVVAARRPSLEALVCALLGRLPQARAALELAKAKETVGLDQITRAIIAAREEDWAQARMHLASLEAKQVGGNIGYLARTLDALCVEKMTGELRHVDRVGLFAEASPDELRRHWPELVAFVERAPAW
jgi:tetratricopeptide (TPR) repeat protein